MEEFKGNPDISTKTEDKRISEPVTSAVRVKKNSLFSKFFANDLHTTTKSVLNDILLPGFKNLLVNVLKRTVDYAFLGTYNTQNTNGYVNYSSFGVPRNITYSNGYNQPTNTPAKSLVNSQTKSSIYAINDIIFEERGAAEEVLARMIEAIQRYGMVSVLDFYDLINQKTNATDNKYGWKDLSSAYVDRKFEGYKIVFPRVITLED